MGDSVDVAERNDHATSARVTASRQDANVKQTAERAKSLFEPIVSSRVPRSSSNANQVLLGGRTWQSESHNLQGPDSNAPIKPLAKTR